MSEHERRINDKQIKAYEQGDTSCAKVQNNLVPRLGQHYAKIQMQYLSKDKSMPSEDYGDQLIKSIRRS